MGLSTHVLDTYHGRPASGMGVSLFQTRADQATLVRRVVLNSDGRNPQGPLLGNDELQVGTYRLVFEVADYFRAQGLNLPDPPFLGQVSLDFGVADPQQHYHVPLVCTPWTYSTYRGS